jgi:hypothetical protein
MSEKKRMARLEALFVTDLKKREKAERKLATEQTANRELRSDLKVLKS